MHLLLACIFVEADLASRYASIITTIISMPHVACTAAIVCHPSSSRPIAEERPILFRRTSG